jgi:hypothetical protein
MVSPWKPSEVRSYHVGKGFTNLTASNGNTEPQTSYVVFFLRDKLKSDIIIQSALLVNMLRNIIFMQGPSVNRAIFATLFFFFGSALLERVPL